MTHAEVRARYGDYPGLAFDHSLRRQLCSCETVYEADSQIAIRAMQIVRTGMAGRRPATPEQRAWAEKTWQDGAPKDPNWAYGPIE